MKSFLRYILYGVLITGFLVIRYSASAQTTTIYLVRHAEKETTQGNDPDLSEAGHQRATELLKKLEHENIAAVYITNYKRTAQTGQPTAQKFNLTEQVYNPADLKGFAVKLLQDYKGKTVLIVGHSNTVIPTVASFGANTPFEALTDDDYDMLFKVVVDKNGKATLKVSYYGEKHHTTEIPSN